MARQIEHVGSTSVPGLCAKPIIDILLMVTDAADESTYVGALEKAGYALRIREPDWFEHRMFQESKPDVHLHVFSQGTSEAGRMLCFRDWLRSNQADREKYAHEKRELARRKWRHIQDYADAKSSVVQEIMNRAGADEQ
ncbi:GrpB family protein [Virgibacillus sediminis]|uniref:GrpB family protein n=1 Tax=Virgibacillus sediminis TaxID=202260 RepID=A0ABV7A8I4_9BACI